MNEPLLKLADGKHIVRIVPNKYTPDMPPMVELKFYYKLNGKNYLAPCCLGKPDPICEVITALIASGSEEEKVVAEKLRPVSRTYAPVLVRGEESLGIRWWGFGIKIYREILKLAVSGGDMFNEKYGKDIEIDLRDGEIKSATLSADSTPISIDQYPYADNITDIFKCPTYDELKEVITEWLGFPEQTSHLLPESSNPQPIFDNYIKSFRKLLRHGKKENLSADVLKHLEVLVQTTEMLSELEKNKETEKFNGLLVDFVSYTFRQSLILRDNDTISEEFWDRYMETLHPLHVEIFNVHHNNEKLLALYKAEEARAEKERQENEAEETRIAEEEERERLQKTRCSVCGQPGRYHIKPSFEGVAYSHHVIDLEDGEYVTDIGQTINPPQYFACATCLEHFKVNNPNYDGMKFWKGEEWQRRHNLVCDAGIEYHL